MPSPPPPPPRLAVFGSFPVIDFLFRRHAQEYNVRVDTTSEKALSIGKFTTGLPPFSKKKIAGNHWSLRKDGPEGRHLTATMRVLVPHHGCVRDHYFLRSNLICCHDVKPFCLVLIQHATRKLCRNFWNTLLRANFPNITVRVTSGVYFVHLMANVYLLERPFLRC
jgi:hypothetical protein